MGVSFKIRTLFHEFVTSQFTVIALEMHLITSYCNMRCCERECTAQKMYGAKMANRDVKYAYASRFNLNSIYTSQPSKNVDNIVNSKMISVYSAWGKKKNWDDWHGLNDKK